MGQTEAPSVAEAWWFWWLGLKSVVVGCWRWVVSVVGIRYKFQWLWVAISGVLVVGILGWVKLVDGEAVVIVCV